MRPDLPLEHQTDREYAPATISTSKLIYGSETTSLNSAGAVYKGYLEHGRRYQSVREASHPQSLYQ